MRRARHQRRRHGPRAKCTVYTPEHAKHAARGLTRQRGRNRGTARHAHSSLGRKVAKRLVAADFGPTGGSVIRALEVSLGIIQNRLPMPVLPHLHSTTMKSSLPEASYVGLPRLLGKVGSSAVKLSVLETTVIGVPVAQMLLAVPIELAADELAFVPIYVAIRPLYLIFGA